MLFDPRWEKKTKAEDYTLAGLTAWLETQPPHTAYEWHDCKGGCLIGLYGKAISGDQSRRWEGFHNELWRTGKLYIASDFPHTFGAALERARDALIAE